MAKQATPRRPMPTRRFRGRTRDKMVEPCGVCGIPYFKGRYAEHDCPGQINVVDFITRDTGIYA